MIEQSVNCVLIISWMRQSVCMSMEAVASSMQMIFEWRKSARTIQMSCLCPTLKFSPPSDTCPISPPSTCLMTVSMCARQRAFQICLLLYWLHGSMLYWTVPVNSVCSCGMMVRAERIEDSFMSTVFIPSMMTEPSTGLMIWNKESSVVDFPLPV